MKLNKTSLAVLWGTLLLTMASIIPPVAALEQLQRDDATPTRPELVDGIPRPSEDARERAATAAAVGRVVQQEAEEGFIQRQSEGEQQKWHEFLKRRPAEEEEIERRIEPPTSQTLTAANASSSTSTVGVTVVSSSGAAGVTAMAVFTAGGGIYTVTSASGMVVVDGKTLSVGSGGQLIGGEEVSEVSSGLVANGQTIAFTAVTTSAIGSGTGAGTVPPAIPTTGVSLPGTVIGASTNSAASGTSGSSAPTSSTASAGGAAPALAVVAGGNVNAVTVLGALFGWLLL